jgi:hypothetical protein
MPQIDRRHPSVSEFDMVLMAPAPGVRLITMQATNNESQREKLT